MPEVAVVGSCGTDTLFSKLRAGAPFLASFARSGDFDRVERALLPNYKDVIPNRAPSPVRNLLVLVLSAISPSAASVDQGEEHSTTTAS
jgi:hypothetical protein